MWVGFAWLQALAAVGLGCGGDSTSSPDVDVGDGVAAGRAGSIPVPAARSARRSAPVALHRARRSGREARGGTRPAAIRERPAAAPARGFRTWSSTTPNAA